MALQDVMRVDNGKVIRSGGTSDYTDLTNKPSINSVELSGNKTTSDLGINADNVMMSDGVTSVEDAVDELNRSSSTTKSTSYGTLYITRYGKVVELNGVFSNLPTSEWSTFATGLPLPKSGTQHQFVNLSADAGNQVSVNLTSNGTLQYYGRGISAFVLEITYISE